jgi:hypothetical protein
MRVVEANTDLGEINGATHDAVDACLRSLTDTLELIRGLSEQTTEQAQRTRERRLEGASYLAAVAAEDQPVVELVSRMIDALVVSGARLRRAEARALHQEGATMEEIAQLFGVTRQRVSALLKSSDGVLKLPSDESPPADD